MPESILLEILADYCIAFYKEDSNGSGNNDQDGTYRG